MDDGMREVAIDRMVQRGVVDAAGCRLSEVLSMRLKQAAFAFPTGISDSASWKRGA